MTKKSLKKRGYNQGSLLAKGISEKLGIEASVIDRAKELVSSENVRFEDVLTRLDQQEHHTQCREQHTLEQIVYLLQGMI